MRTYRINFTGYFHGALEVSRPLVLELSAESKADAKNTLRQEYAGVKNITIKDLDA